MRIPAVSISLIVASIAGTAQAQSIVLLSCERQMSFGAVVHDDATDTTQTDSDQFSFPGLDALDHEDAAYLTAGSQLAYSYAAQISTLETTGISFAVTTANHAWDGVGGQAHGTSISTFALQFRVDHRVRLMFATQAGNGLEGNSASGHSQMLLTGPGGDLAHIDRVANGYHAISLDGWLQPGVYTLSGSAQSTAEAGDPPNIQLAGAFSEARLTIGCAADFNYSGFVDTDDFDAFVQAFELGQEECDIDSSGFVDTDDFDAFVLDFIAGC